MGKVVVQVMASFVVDLIITGQLHDSWLRIGTFTFPFRSAFLFQKAAFSKRPSGFSVQALFPWAQKLQNSPKVEISGGSRQAIPTMAIGSTLGWLVDSIVDKYVAKFLTFNYMQIPPGCLTIYIYSFQCTCLLPLSPLRNSRISCKCKDIKPY